MDFVYKYNPYYKTDEMTRAGFMNGAIILALLIFLSVVPQLALWISCMK